MTRRIYSAPREYEHWPVEYVEEEIVEEEQGPSGDGTQDEAWPRGTDRSGRLWVGFSKARE